MLEKLIPSKLLPALSPNGPATATTPELCPRQLAADRTRILMGSFRRGQADDPAVYVSAVASVLVAYPEPIVRKVTDPLHGLASECDFLPTVAEVKRACERHMHPLRAAAEREARFAETRLLLAPASDRATPEERERAVARWERERGEKIGRQRKAAEVIRREAELRLTELYHESLKPAPIAVGAELAQKLAAVSRETTG